MLYAIQIEAHIARQISDIAAMTVLIAVRGRVFIARAADVFGCRQQMCRVCNAAAHFENTIHFGVIAGVRFFANILYHRRELLVERKKRRQRAAICKEFFKLKLRSLLH